VKTLSRFFLRYGIRKTFDLSIIHYRQIKAARTEIEYFVYSCLVICPLESTSQDQIAEATSIHIAAMKWTIILRITLQNIHNCYLIRQNTLNNRGSRAPPPPPPPPPLPVAKTFSVSLTF
jgi:hypothetical protein